MNRIAIERILDGENDPGGGAAAGDFFDDDGVRDVVEACAALGFGKRDTGEAEFGGFCKEFARKMTGFIIFAGAGFYFRVGKFANGFLEEELVVGESEVQMRITCNTKQCNAGSAEG